MLQRSIQSVLELTSNGCYSVGSRASWSCLKWVLQRSIQSVWEVDWNGCCNVASTLSWSCLKWSVEMDVTTKLPASWGCLKWFLQRNTWKWLSELEKILSRLWNYCACHTKAGVTFAPTLGSHSPLPPTEVGANATPHEVGANATPMPYMIIAILDYWHEINHPASLAASLGYPHDKTNTFKVVFQFS